MAKAIINNHNKALHFEILGKPFGIEAGQIKKVEDNIAEILLKTAHITEVKPIIKPIKRIPIFKILKPKRKKRKGRKKRFNNRLKK